MRGGRDGGREAERGLGGSLHIKKFIHRIHLRDVRHAASVLLLASLELAGKTETEAEAEGEGEAEAEAEAEGEAAGRGRGVRDVTARS